MYRDPERRPSDELMLRWSLMPSAGSQGRKRASARLALAGVLCAAVAALLAPTGASAASCAPGTAQCLAPQVASAPTPVIIDSDLFTNADDVLGLSTAFALQASGQDRVIAITLNRRTNHSSVDPDTWMCAAAIAQFYNSGSVPIGADMPGNTHDSMGGPGDFTAPCAADAVSPPAPQSAVTVLRQALASQPDHTVVIIEIGYEENLEALLQSPADGVSPLDGHDLVALKVKELVLTGGVYDGSIPTENNLAGDPAAANYVAANWPTKAVYQGHEVGNAVFAGASIDSSQPSSSPVRAAYDAYNTGAGYMGNPIKAWDAVTAYHAIVPGDASLSEVGPGQNSVDMTTGANTFTTGTGDQYYLQLNSATNLESAINPLLDMAPGSAPPPVPVNTTAPAISGSAVQGQTLSAGVGVWSNSPTGDLYQWQQCNAQGANCTEIANATGSTYSPGAPDLGHTLRVMVTAFNTGYGLPATSASTAVVTAPPAAPPPPPPPAPVLPALPVELSLPAISGNAVQGATLTAIQGSWSNSPSGYHHQWEDCNSSGTGCTPITGATGTTYVLAPTDVGSRIVVVETATNAGGNGLGASSAATAVVLPLPPVTLGVKALVRSRAHRATFHLSASGSVTSFQCALVRLPGHGKKPRVHYRACGTSVTFKHLRSGRYLLSVRAVGPGGVASPVTHRFRIR